MVASLSYPLELPRSLLPQTLFRAFLVSVLCKFLMPLQVVIRMIVFIKDT